MICSYKPTFERKFIDANYVSLGSGDIHQSRIINNLHVLLYVVSGEWDIIQNGEYFRMQKDDCVLLHVGYHHLGKSGAAPGTKVMFMHITPDPGDKGQCTEKTDGIPIATLTHCAGNPRVRQLMEGFIAIRGLEDERRNFIKESAALTELLCELSELRDTDKTNYGDFVRSVMDLFNANKDRFFSGKQLETLLDCNIKTINKRFIAERGESIYQYQLRMHLKDVYDYIEYHPDVKMSELAEMFGFCDEYHMSRVFKKEYGFTPVRHKRDVRNYQMKMK